MSNLIERVYRIVSAILKKRLAVFDFDDTLVSSGGSVTVEHEGGEKTEMDSSTFAYFKGTDGDKIDFSDFNNVTKPRIIKKGWTALIKAAEDEETRVVILTARPKGAASAVKKFMDKVDLEAVEVVALQSSDPMDKARWIEQAAGEGVEEVTFTDDSTRNVAAVETLNGKIKAKVNSIHQDVPKDGDYEGGEMSEVFESDEPTSAKVEVKKPEQKALHETSEWWKNQSTEFKQKYCKDHPESGYCKAKVAGEVIVMPDGKQAEKAFEEMVSKMAYIGGPFFMVDFGSEGFVTVEIKPVWGEVRLSFIKVPAEYRGHGLASRVLTRLTQIADKHGVKMSLSADPQERGGLTKAQLFKWYARHGFKRMPYLMQQDKLSDNMEREPKGMKTASIQDVIDRIERRVRDADLANELVNKVKRYSISHNPADDLSSQEVRMIYGPDDYGDDFDLSNGNELDIGWTNHARYRSELRDVDPSAVNDEIREFVEKNLLRRFRQKINLIKNGIGKVVVDIDTTMNPERAGVVTVIAAQARWKKEEPSDPDSGYVRDDGARLDPIFMGRTRPQGWTYTKAGGKPENFYYNLRYVMVQIEKEDMKHGK